jgi:hypothetical protein
VDEMLRIDLLTMTKSQHISWGKGTANNAASYSSARRLAALASFVPMLVVKLLAILATGGVPHPGGSGRARWRVQVPCQRLEHDGDRWRIDGRRHVLGKPAESDKNEKHLF